MKENICFGHEAMSSPQWSLRTLNKALRDAMDASLLRCGVTEPGQPLILFLLSSANGAEGLNQKELASMLNVSAATVTASLKTLERQGCIVRSSDSGDMRCKRISITERGRDMESRCRKAFCIVHKGMYSGFSQEELETLAAFFRRMETNLAAVSAKETDV